MWPDICGWQLLENHQLKFTCGKKEKCKKCEKLFQTKGERRKHYSECKYIIVCNLCNVECNGLKKYKDHKLKLHAFNVTFECQVCKEKFLMKEQLLQHISKKHSHFLKLNKK